MDLPQKIAELPWAALLPVGLAFLVGVVLWASGRKLLRSAFAGAGLLAGALGGLLLTESGPIASWGAPPWVVVGVLAVAAAIIAGLAYRLVLAASVAALLGLVAPLGVFVAVEMGAVTIEEGEITVQQPLAAGETDWWDVLADEGGEGATDVSGEAGAAHEPTLILETDESDENQTAQWRRWLTQVREILVDVGEGILERSPQPLRWVMAASAAVGMLLGLFLGAAAPAFSAALLTALGGSLLLVSCGWTMVTRLGWSAEWMPSTAPQWLAWWAIAAVIGLIVQWTIRGKRADKAAS